MTTEEFAEVLGLLSRVYATEAPRAYLTAGEFEHRWHTVYPPGSPRPARIWRDGATPVGFAWCDAPYALVVTALGWDHREDEIYTWAEGDLRARGGQVYALAFDGDERRTALLCRRGYRSSERGMVLRARSLDGELPQPVLPCGYQLRRLSGEADTTARAAVYERAFPDERMPADLYQAVTGSPSYRADLDLIITAPDGAFAAFATVWHDPANRMGVFEPIGCDPTHQRRGLATALLWEGMRRLRALGAETARVSTGVTRAPANRLYEATGFRLVDRQMAWEWNPHPRPGEPSPPSPLIPVRGRGGDGSQRGGSGPNLRQRRF